jgi:hypothetical protein
MAIYAVLLLRVNRSQAPGKGTSQIAGLANRFARILLGGCPYHFLKEWLKVAAPYLGRSRYPTLRCADGMVGPHGFPTGISRGYSANHR